MTNANPLAGGIGIFFGDPVPAPIPSNVWALSMCYGKVSPGGWWDHKWRLDDLLGIRYAARDRATPFWTPVRDDPAPERLSYDVWSNIHYGYVGRAHGIPMWILTEAQHHIGASTPADDYSIEIGFRLWSTYHFGLTKAGLHHAIVSNLPRWRSMDTSWTVRPGFYFTTRP